MIKFFEFQVTWISMQTYCLHRQKLEREKKKERENKERDNATERNSHRVSQDVKGK